MVTETLLSRCNVVCAFKSSSLLVAPLVEALNRIPLSFRGMKWWTKHSSSLPAAVLQPSKIRQNTSLSYE